MKKWIIFTCLFFGLFFCIQAQVVEGVKKSAERKTTSQISKKVNKGIEGIFNKKKKKKKSEEETTSKNTEPTNSEETTEKTSTTDQSAKTQNEAPQFQMKKNDFVAGTLIIFEDSLKGEQMGEFPSKWDLDNGTAENAIFDNKNAIIFGSSGTQIRPLMDEENYLPEQFTIECDIYFHSKGNEAYTISLGLYHKVLIRSNSASCKNSKTRASTFGTEAGWRHVAISFNKRALKVYINGERLLNIPNLEQKPLNVALKALSYGADKGFPSLVTNIRIAEGAVPLYDRLNTDGKIVTNDIHFESGEANLKSGSMIVIQQIADLMQKHTDVRFSIEGHTDGDGTEMFNQKLSEQRAIAVKNALEQKGIARQRMQTKGFGESMPIGSNDNDEGKYKNRRVEFVLLK